MRLAGFHNDTGGNVQKTKVEPAMVLVFYKGSTIVTQHDIQTSADEKQYISSGTPLTKERMQVLYEGITGSSSAGFSVMGTNVLHNDSTHLVWTSKSQQLPMWFMCKGKRVSLKKVPYPSLLWSLTKSSGGVTNMRIAALRADRRPSEKTKLYHAPLMNVGKTGELCYGTADIPRFIDTARIHEYEEAVFNSNFSHVNHQQTFKPSVANEEISNAKHIKQWRSLTKVEKFPATLLQPTGLTLEEWING